MSVTVVVGSQWGDEAKGKFVDLLAQGVDVVGRFNGGDNAGHTVVNRYGTFKVRLMPNGFSSPNTRCVIGPGVVVNLKTLIEELENIQSKGIDLLDRLWVSPRCHVVMPYHPLLEGIYEEAKGAGRTGTTRRGMGPVYADKVSYNGIRLADLADPQVLEEKLNVQLAVKNALFKAFGVEPLEVQAVAQEKLAQFAQVQSAVREPFGLIQEALRSGQAIVLEGAQAALLDTDWGTYPYCTASNTLAGGACQGLGIAPHWLERIVGVSKAYTTRVGAGPMPTELNVETGAGRTLLEAGQEFGTVTGRPRRCGWFDAELVRFTTQLNGCTELALTKLDVLDSLPAIKIGVGYRCGANAGGLAHAGEVAHYWQGDARWLESCEPEYIEMEGWQQPTTGIREFDRLPAQAQAYVHKIEELVGAPVGFVSVGPGRDETIVVQR